MLAVASDREVSDARSGLAEHRALTPAEAASSNDALERRDRYRTVSIASFAVAALAGVTGASLFVFDTAAPPAPTRDHGRGYGVAYRAAF